MTGNSTQLIPLNTSSEIGRSVARGGKNSFGLGFRSRTSIGVGLASEGWNGRTIVISDASAPRSSGSKELRLGIG